MQQYSANRLKIFYFSTDIFPAESSEVTAASFRAINILLIAIFYHYSHYFHFLICSISWLCILASLLGEVMHLIKAYGVNMFYNMPYFEGLGFFLFVCRYQTQVTKEMDTKCVYSFSSFDSENWLWSVPTWEIILLLAWRSVRSPAPDLTDVHRCLSAL